MIRTLSMFSGCGGLDCGMEMAGFQPHAFVDFEPTCRETLRMNYPKIPCFENVFDSSIVSFCQAHTPSAIYGGPPCQPFSTMGKHRHFEDERGKALLQYCKVIELTNPTAFLMENVKGLVVADNGELLQYIVDLFRKTGYKISWNVVNAVNYGIPQSRERLIMIGSKKRFVPIPGFGKSPSMTLRDAIGGLEDSSDGLDYPQYLEAIMSHVPEGGNWRCLPEKLRKKAMGNADLKSGGLSGYCRRLSYDKPSPTLLTSPIQRATLLGHPTENRPLSVAEYKRIQGFPDTWKMAGSISSQYRQLGNAVPVQLAYEMGKLLQKGV